MQALMNGGLLLSHLTSLSTTIAMSGVKLDEHTDMNFKSSGDDGSFSEG